jgi:hypothetical protein
MNVDEKEENENVANLLLRVAQISRMSYSQSKKLFRMMKEKYIELKKIDENCFEKENVLIEFSSWVKNSEKNEEIKEEYQKILKQENLFEKEENQFLTKLFYDLAILYFHCEITFPLVVISFKKKEDFNSSEMIDFINRGKNRKVNFVFLPSLFSNGNFLQNGKSWVFTYTKNTFRFKDLKDDSLDELIEKENIIPKKENKKDNYIKVYCENKSDAQYIKIETNIYIPENQEYEFKFYLMNKKDNKFYTRKTKSKSFKIGNDYEIKRYELKIDNKVVFSSKK